MTKILWAGLSWAQMGRHSGLAPLPRLIEQRRPGTLEMVPNVPALSRWVDVWRTRLRHVCGLEPVLPEWAIIQRDGVPFYGHDAWYAERSIMGIVERNAPDWVVMTSVEDQLFLLANHRCKWESTRLAAFSHQPPTWWQSSHRHPEVVQALDLLIVLSTKAEACWHAQLPPDRIVFLPHGVDTDFFKPSGNGLKPMGSEQPLRVVCCGQWLRDFETLTEAIEAVVGRGLPIQFDLVVSRSQRRTAPLARLNTIGQVTWHHHLSDEQLRDVYRGGDVLLLALIDGCANNSLLEGMACGLPVAVTDIGGSRDYTRSEFTDYLEPASSAAIVNLLSHYMENRRDLGTRGKLARAHAEQYLSWRVVADRLIERLAGSG